MVLDDWSKIKILSKSDLLSLVPDGFTFKTEPWRHQLASFVAASVDMFYGCGGFLPALDMGTGKTKVAIDLASLIKLRRGQVRVLAICLNNAVENWVDEVGMHSNLSAVAIRGGPKQRWSLLMDGDTEVKVVNFEGLRSLLSAKTMKKKSTGVNLDAVRSLVRAMEINFLVIDESHLIKSPSSLNYKMCHAIAEAAANRNSAYRLELTGTPFGNSQLDVWSQYSLLDGGETFGDSFDKFKKAYFENKGYMVGFRWQDNWVPTEFGKNTIRDNIFRHAIRYSEDEVEDLPEKIYNVVKHDLGKDQRMLYDGRMAALKKIIEDANLTRETNKTISRHRIMLRYICSGFEREIGAKEYTELKSNPKLDAVLDVLQEVMLSGHKAVVFYEFNPEGEMLVRAITRKLRVKVAHLHGDTKDKYGEWKVKFQGNKAYRVLVANTASGSQSINLTEANYCLFYSNSHRIILRIQAEKRISRGGQKAAHTYFYDFVGRETIEERILRQIKAHRQGIKATLDREDLIYGL